MVRAYQVGKRILCGLAGYDERHERRPPKTDCERRGDAPAPCCALNLVEDGDRLCAFLALRLDRPVPPRVTAGGFTFGHRLLGTSEFDVVQFGFEFYGFATYHLLLNPNNRVAGTVLESMIEDGSTSSSTSAPIGVSRPSART